MEIPKFLMADNTDCPDANFVIHTDFPRFIIDLVSDEIEWLEDIDQSDKADLEAELPSLIEQASEFFDREVARYEE
ncbi:hypothetical protein SAMN05216480_101759 [Pustulibacterium marinum]|uniref:Uncharacterized protein n=1 Tax=Pustulibacterium marinum TaxID=1224947 RepID=A0A1I7F964_9FLAO|nr:hypothetical protein [Pustulibacterium marinum]SFU32738.1 hypothetical protein SAMN05216480_101759 [Pustulibacterium marinum]